MTKLAVKLWNLGCREVDWLEWPEASAGDDATDWRQLTADPERDLHVLLEQAAPWWPPADAEDSNEGVSADTPSAAAEEAGSAWTSAHPLGRPLG